MDLGSSGVGEIAVYPVLVKKVRYFSCRQTMNSHMLILCFSCYFRVQLLLRSMALETLEMND